MAEIVRSEWNEGILCMGRLHPPLEKRPWTVENIDSYLLEAVLNGITQMFMPKFDVISNKILTVEQLFEKRPMQKGRLHVRHNSSSGGICGGILKLKPGSGVIVPCAGCPLIVLTVNPVREAPFCMVLHGHHSLLIEPCYMKPKHWGVNIIEKALKYLRERYSIKPDQVSLTTFGGIHPIDYPHDVNASNEYREVNYLYPDYLSYFLPSADLEKLLPHHNGVQCFDPSETACAIARENGVASAARGEYTPPSGERGYTSSGLAAKHPDEKIRKKERERRNLATILCPSFDHY